MPPGTKWAYVFLLAMWIAADVVNSECELEWKEFNGSCWRVTKDTFNGLKGADGEKHSDRIIRKCAEVGGRPASIHSKEENDFVTKNVIAGLSGPWLSLRNGQEVSAHDKLNWIWLDDTPLDFNLRDGRDIYKQELGVVIHPDGKWTQRSLREESYGICKKASLVKSNPPPHHHHHKCRRRHHKY
ncbi:lectin c-type domain-containing protein [Ditylenchus destructor]|nr:lectin c-type domain-containing protein [Ditylenchus destructor]